MSTCANVNTLPEAYLTCDSVNRGYTENGVKWLSTFYNLQSVAVQQPDQGKYISEITVCT